MSKYTFDWDDSEADSMAKLLTFTSTSGALSGYSSDLARTVADQISEQKGLPVPSRLGAVVRCGERFYVRVANDGRQRNPWWLIGEGDDTGGWFKTEDLPRVDELKYQGFAL